MGHRIQNYLIKTTDTAKELFFVYFGIILAASFFYSMFEKKQLFDSIWWAIVTGLTVGYGDTYPTTPGGRIIGVILMHTTVFFILPLVTARLASKLIVNSDAFDHTEQEQIKNDLRQIKDVLLLDNESHSTQQQKIQRKQVRKKIRPDDSGERTR